jgi:hypothetical protein
MSFDCFTYFIYIIDLGDVKTLGDTIALKLTHLHVQGMRLWNKVVIFCIVFAGCFENLLRHIHNAFSEFKRILDLDRDPTAS